MRSHFLASTLLLTSLAGSLYAQEAATPPKPKTKMESFMLQDGVVVVQGFSTIGAAEGLYNAVVTVDSKELTNPATPKKEYGITIEVAQGSTRSQTTHTSYVDYDELPSLLKGIDYILKINNTSTKLDNFQATYSTKGDLKFASFNTESKVINVAVSSGTIGKATAYYDLGKFEKLRELVVKAKAKLDEIKQ